MYKFVDTNEVSTEVTLPIEAMSYNGIYLENEIPGYRTLYVSGRELMGSENQIEEINLIDGSNYLGRRYPSRSITATYQLISENEVTFRDAFNKMNILLSKEQVEVIFNDEKDKYFIGTKVGNDEAEPGTNHTVGTIEIYCSNPFKYSAALKEVAAISNADGILEAALNNTGSVPVAIDYEITHKDESGYVGIISDKGAMQYGFIEEADTEKRIRSEVLVNYKKATDFSTMAVNVVIPNDIENLVRNGTLKNTTQSGNTYVALDNAGSGNWWHGASKTLTIPLNSSKTYSKDFYIETKVWFETSQITQTGLIYFMVSDEAKNHICSFNLQKWQRGDNWAYAYLDGKEVKFSPNSSSPTSLNKGAISIRKTGELLEFVFGGKKYQSRNPVTKDKRAKYLTLYLGQYATGGNSDKMLMKRLYFKELLYRSDGVNYIYDIPNRYQPGDVCTINGNTSKYYVNGVYSPGDEITGTQYFKAPQGESKVQFAVSDWTTANPVVKLRIREAWL